MLSTEGSAQAVIERAARWHLGHGDALVLARELADNSLDSLVTDPPGGIGFMGKEWDTPQASELPLPLAMRAVVHAKHYPADRRFREREWFVWWLAERLSEAYRVLKPGAHGVTWSIPRTAHWTGMALELAGFEIIDQIEHVFSQGMGKSKSARRMLAMEHCELPGRHAESSLPGATAMHEPGDHVCLEPGSCPLSGRHLMADRPGAEPGDHVCADHSPETEWDGYGTGLAPSHEGWWLFRKPLDGTIAENLVKWRTGVLDIDGSRVPRGSDLGGWPKDVLFTHAPGCELVGTALVPANPSWDTPNRETEPSLFTGGRVSRVRHGSRAGEASAARRYTGSGSASFARTPGRRRDDTEEIDVWECEPGCAVYAFAAEAGETSSGMLRAGTVRTNRFGFTGPLPERVSRDTFGDSGPVTRFFVEFPHEPTFCAAHYLAKPARAEKEAGLANFRRRSAAEATGSADGQARLQNARTGAGRTGNVRNSHPCLTPDSLVITQVGLLPISQVRVGELVLAADGRFRRAVEVSSHAGAKHVFTLRVAGTNHAVKATADHPFLVWRPTKKRNSVMGDALWLPAKHVSVGDYTMTPILDAPIDEKDIHGEDYWFVVGLWLAQGSISGSARAGRYPAFTLNKGKPEQVERIRRVFPEARVYSRRGVNSVDVVVLRAGVAEQLVALCGKLARHKCLSPVVFQLASGSRQALLDGYVSGDGWNKEGELRLSTVSPHLAAQIPLLAEMQGYRTSLYWRKPGKDKHIGLRKIVDRGHYRMYLRPPPEAPRRPHRVTHEGREFTLRRVKSISEVPYEGAVWNLSVEGSPTFQTVVGMSHNTTKGVKWMQYLVRLVTPPGGVTLDLFAGSGTTGVAAVSLGRGFIGYELLDTDTEPHASLARARIHYAAGGGELVPRPSLRPQATEQE